MDRVVVVGCSGSGKTTVAKRLSAALALPHLEMDAVYHQPNWTPVGEEEFQGRLTEFASQDRWVADGNYFSHGSARLIWPVVDTVVWLDLPKSVVMRQVIARTLRRAATREVLWNGNREPWTNLYSRDPEKNIIVWTWTRFDKYRTRYQECASDGTWAHAEVHRLSSKSGVEEFLSSVEQPPEQ